MPSPIPQTTANDLIDRISRYTLADAPSEFEARLFLKEAEKLKRINAAEGWMAEGIIHSLVGDLDASQAAFERSLQTASDNLYVVAANYVNGLRMLGKHVEAYELAKRFLKENNQQLREIAYDYSIDLGLVDDALQHKEMLGRIHGGAVPHANYVEKLKALCDQLDIGRDALHSLHLVAQQQLYAAKVLSWEINATLDPENPISLIIEFAVDADSDQLSDIEWGIFEQLAATDIPAVNQRKIIPVVRKLPQ